MSLEAGNRLRDQFGWNFYCGGMKNGDQVLDAFITGSDQVLIATTAASSGLDVDVSTVILYQGAFDAITATQQAGRPGRRPGSIGRCIALVSKSATTSKTTDDNVIAWNTFINTRGCRRMAIESYIDSCWRQPCYGTEERCDNCTITDNDDFSAVSHPKLTTPEWAFNNTIKSPTSNSTLNPRGYCDTEMWSTPPIKVRKLQVLEEELFALSSKRARTVDRDAISLSSVPPTLGSGKSSDLSSLGDSFKTISSVSTGDAVHKSHDLPHSFPTATSTEQQLVWDQLQKWNKQQSVTVKDLRIVDAVKTLGQDNVRCVYCWFYQIGRHNNHTWGFCQYRQQALPNASTKALDGLKITMKRYWKRSAMVSLLTGFHMNCWTPLSSLHPAANFNMSTDCSHTGLLLGLVEAGLQDRRVGQRIGDQFRLYPGQEEGQRAETLIKPSPDRDISIVLWDVFLLFYGFRQQLEGETVTELV